MSSIDEELETGATRELAATRLNPRGPNLSGQLALPTGALVAGRFVVIRRLGTGGMGEVFEAEDTEIGGIVAIKVVRPEVVDSEDLATRLRREVQLARDVTHPNVCRTFDLYRHVLDDGREVAVVGMELLDGEDLARRIAREPLSVEAALPILRQIARGLYAAHRLGIVHRDLKPSNVLLVPESDGTRAVVTDFGIALRTTGHGADITLTQTGFALGSPAYMAPEQLSGDAVTPATDVYALGLLAHEMVAGSSPFADTTPWLAVTKRLVEEPIDAGREVPGLDPRYAAFIARCLKRDPKERFDDMEDVLRFLDFGDPDWDAYGRKQPAAAGPFSKPAMTPKLVAGSAMAALLVSALAISAWMRRSPTAPSTSPPTSESAAVPKPSSDPVAPGSVASEDAEGATRPGVAVAPSSYPDESETAVSRPVASTRTPGVAEALSRAARALTRHDGADALAILDPWWRRDADSAVILARMADAQSMVGASKKALRTAERALAAASDLDRQQQLEIESRFLAFGPDRSRSRDLAFSLWTVRPKRLDLGLYAVEALLRAGALDEARRALESLRSEHASSDDPRIDLLAARWADGVVDNESQIAWSRQAAEKARTLQAPILLAEARLLETAARRRVGDLDTAEDAAGAALEVGKARNHERLRADAETALAGIALDRGSLDAAWSRLDDALARYSSLGHPEGQVRVLGAMGSVRQAQGDIESGRAQLERAIDIGTTAGLPVETTQARRRLADLARQQGKFDEALGLIDDVLTFHRQVGDQHGTAQARVDQADVLLHLGQIRPAIETAEAAKTVFEARGDQRGLVAVAVLHAMASLAAGRVAEAMTAIDQVLESEPEPPVRFEALVARGRALLLRGDGPALAATLETLDESAQMLGRPRYLATAAWLRARADLQAGEGQEAVRRLTRLLGTADPDDDPMARARLELTAAEAYLLRDRRELARTALGRADAALRQKPDQWALWRQQILTARAKGARHPRAAARDLASIIRRAGDSGLLAVVIEARMARALLIGDRTGLDRLSAMASKNGLSAVARAAEEGGPCVACF